MNTYAIGTKVRIATLFETASVAVDPTVVKFSYKPVSYGAATTLIYLTDAALVRDSAGNYHVDLDTSNYGGEWRWRFWSTGTGQSSTEGSFYVRPNAAVTVAVTPAAWPVETDPGGAGYSSVATTNYFSQGYDYLNFLDPPAKTASQTNMFTVLAEDNNNASANEVSLYPVFIDAHPTGTRASAVALEGDIIHTGAGTTTGEVGVLGYASVRAGVVTNAYAVQGAGEVTGGTVTNAGGAQAYPIVSGGTVTNLFGFKAAGPSISGGTVTNNYGIYIGRVGSLGVTRNIPLWIESNAVGVDTFVDKSGRVAVRCTSSSASLSEAVSIPNAEWIGGRDASDVAWKKVIRLNGSNFVELAGDGSTILLSGPIAAGLSTTGSFGAQGVISAQTSAAGAGNAADLTDDTLFTYTLPVNALSGNGKSIRVTAFGHFATNGNDKLPKIFMAGTSVAPSAVSAVSNKDFSMIAEITRIDATHVSCVGVRSVNAELPLITVTPNLVVADLSANTSIIKFTGASPTSGAASDVLGYQMRVEFMN